MDIVGAQCASDDRYAAMNLIEPHPNLKGVSAPAAATPARGPPTCAPPHGETRDSVQCYSMSETGIARRRETGGR